MKKESDESGSQNGSGEDIDKTEKTIFDRGPSVNTSEHWTIETNRFKFKKSISTQGSIDISLKNFS